MSAPLPTHQYQGDGQKVVRKNAWKTRNQDLTVEVTTGESWKRNREIGNDRDSENVETTTHDGDLRG